MRLILAAALPSGASAAAPGAAAAAAAAAAPAAALPSEAQRLAVSQNAMLADAAAANMARAVEALLGLTTELKQTLVLNDFSALNAQLLPRHRSLALRAQDSRDVLADMRADLADVQSRIQRALLHS
ncbi:hypothetical protein HK105_202413 [Polyrhizophydium stewartii]|uniref:Biogenesis of lysosome-related organelles complex 1 subunit 7 n=1 Tax=Polyrhizophydium stewartii TaxID=2732419 RepID=A0ABR4NEV3_9FUNG